MFAFCSRRRFPAAVLLASASAFTAFANPWTVATENDLRRALAASTGAQNGDTINFAANVTLTSALPAVQTSVTIAGNHFTLVGGIPPGANPYSGLVVRTFPSGSAPAPAITVAIKDLTITGARAAGGDGHSGGSTLYGGGGGGAGLGGALFVGSGTSVTLADVTLTLNAALGGAGGAPGGSGGYTGGAGGAASLGGYAGPPGGNGGFGGGGGGPAASPQLVLTSVGDPYGSIPGLGNVPGGGNGGFGGGGGAAGGSGGFCGGAGASAASEQDGGGGGGGGGAGLGGAVFVQTGGSLTVTGPLLIDGNTAAGGAGRRGGGNGASLGAGIFLQGGDAADGGAGLLSFQPAAGQTATAADAIADQGGNGDSGKWRVVVDAAGTAILAGANSYSGGTDVRAGTLLVNNASGSGAGSGPVYVENGATIGGHGAISGNLVLLPGANFVLGDGITSSLNVGSMLWMGPAKVVLTVDPTGSLSLLPVNGALLKGSGTGFQFAFQGSALTRGQTYTVARYEFTNFQAGDFTFTGLLPGQTGIFQLQAGSHTVTFTVL